VEDVTKQSRTGRTSESADPSGLVDDLYRSRRRDLVRLAFLLVDDVALAEEIVQESFIGLYQHWNNLANADAAYAYVRASVVNRGRSELRRRGRQRRRRPSSDEALTPSSESTVVSRDEHRRVLAAVQGLPKRQREVLVLRYWQNMSEADIAVILRISKGSVKSAASRGVGAVKRQITKEIQ
jgi:RNA polymerase sigma-70 factor (sigma-E family)